MAPLTRLSIARPLLMLTLIGIFILFGLQSYFALNIENWPEADLPYVTVIIPYPGATAKDVADNILEPVEDAISGVAGVRHMRGTAQENVGLLLIEFVDGTDPDQAAVDVERQISTIRNSLPDEIEEPQIEKLDVNALPILYLTLSGPAGTDALYQLAEDKIVPRLQRAKGVGLVTVAGGRERQINILADPVRMAAYELPLPVIGQALQQDNISLSAGSLDLAHRSVAVRSVGEFQSLADIENLVVGEGPVFLRNVATIEDGLADTGQKVRLNGEEAVLMTVIKAADANAVNLSQAARQVVAELNRELPPQTRLEIIIDNSLFTQAAVEGVQGDLMAAIIITGLILLLFLHTINSAAVVVMTVPVSLIITFLGMRLFGFTLNTLTLLALTVAIGSLVDDAIVITENTERHIRLGKTARQAAFDATGELGFTTLATTLVGVVVYLPVATMEGTVGQFFYQYGVTVTIAFAVSLFLAFSLTPLLAAWWMPDRSRADQPRRGLSKLLGRLFFPLSWLWFRWIVPGFDWCFDRLADGYRVLLRLALANPLSQLAVILIAIAGFGTGVWFLQSGLVPGEFVPYMDNALIDVAIELPAGTNLVATDRTTRRVEDIIRRHVPETAAILTVVGAEKNVLSTAESKNFANITIVLVDKRDRTRSSLQIIEALREPFSHVPDAKIAPVVTDADRIDIELYGPDPETVLRLVEEIKPIIAAVPGAADVRTPGLGWANQTQVVVDQRRANELGLSAGQIALSLRTAINGLKQGVYSPAGNAEAYDIVLRLPESERANLMGLPLAYLDERPVYLGQAARLEESPVSSRVERANRQYSATIYVSPSGRGLTDLLTDIIARLDAHPFTAGTGYGLGPESRGVTEGDEQIMGVLLTSLILIYLLLTGLYESLLQPLAIMSALPVTVVGAIGGLYLAGLSLNIVSMLGIIMLSGLVAKNAILLIDLTNSFRAEGLPRKEALLRAGPQRLRAILMTALSLVFALIPLLLNTGPGSELRWPMAAVVIGGTLVSVAFFILLVPVAYNSLEAAGDGFHWFTRRIIGLGRSAGHHRFAEDGHPAVPGGSARWKGG